MSPEPGPALQVAGPGRSDTKSSQLPFNGVGQKSFAAELIGAPRFTGTDHSARSFLRAATQMSLPPSVPRRLEAMNSCRPLGDSIGQPSLTPGMFMAVSGAAGRHSPNGCDETAVGRMSRATMAPATTGRRVR